MKEADNEGLPDVSEFWVLRMPNGQYFYQSTGSAGGLTLNIWVASKWGGEEAAIDARDAVAKTLPGLKDAKPFPVTLMAVYGHETDLEERWAAKEPNGKFMAGWTSYDGLCASACEAKTWKERRTANSLAVDIAKSLGRPFEVAPVTIITIPGHGIPKEES